MTLAITFADLIDKHWDSLATLATVIVVVLFWGICSTCSRETNP